MRRSEVSYIFIDTRNRIIEAQLSCVFSKEGKWHFAECPELDLIDQGRTMRDAVENLTQMISETLVAAIENGKMTDMMQALGFEEVKPVPEKTFFSQTLKSSGRVPLPSFTIPFDRSSTDRPLICSV